MKNHNHETYFFQKRLLSTLLPNYICWMISYFCFKSIWAFLGSCFFFLANICLISETDMFRFNWSISASEDGRPAPFIEDIIADEEPVLRFATEVGSFEVLFDPLDFMDVGDAGTDPVDSDDPRLPPPTSLTPFDSFLDSGLIFTFSFCRSDPFDGWWCILDAAALESLTNLCCSKMWWSGDPQVDDRADEVLAASLDRPDSCWWQRHDCLVSRFLVYFECKV